jgi:lysozyme family protein
MLHNGAEEKETGMKTNEKNSSIDQAARHALAARRRIERAVEDGRVPTWVLDTCEAWERAALAYGAAMARGDQGPAAIHALPGSGTVH